MDQIEKILRDSLQDAEYADGTPCEVIYKEDIPGIMEQIKKCANNFTPSATQIQDKIDEEYKKHSLWGEGSNFDNGYKDGFNAAVSWVKRVNRGDEI